MLSRVFVYYFPGLNRASESWPVSGSLQWVETHTPSSCDYSDDDTHSGQEECDQSNKVLQRMHTVQVTFILTTRILTGTRLAKRKCPEGILVCEWLSS